MRADFLKRDTCPGTDRTCVRKGTGRTVRPYRCPVSRGWFAPQPRVPWIARACLHRLGAAPGLSIATLAALAREFGRTKMTSGGRNRRHHGPSLEVARGNGAKPLGKQFELGSLWGRHG